MEYKIKNNRKTNIPYVDTNDAIKGYKDSTTAKGETDDCVVRAFAAVTESTYDESHKFIRRVFQRQNREGTKNFDTIMKARVGLKTLGMRYKRMTNHTETTYTKKRKVLNSNWEYEIKPTEVTVSSDYMPLITTYGKTRLNKMSVGSFIKEYPKGSYLISISGHAFAIIDGVVIGNNEDSRRLRARVSNAYKFN
jgi:hypothetical protein